MSVIGDEKQVSDSSSNNDNVSVRGITVDNEKALAGQAPLPIQQDPPAPQGKLDSQAVDVSSQEENDPMQRLSDQEKEIIKRQLDIPTVKVTIGTLYRYATFTDIIVIIISSICAIGGGAALPLMTVSKIYFDGLSMVSQAHQL